MSNPNTNTTDTELWSTIDVPLVYPHTPTVTHVWFSYSLGQQVAGSTRTVTRVDTNVQRPGHGGLPQGWHMKIRAWRARAVAPRAVLASDAWWFWCSTIAVLFNVRDKPYATWTLDELLRAPRLRDGDHRPGSFVIPIELAQQENFEVRWEPQGGSGAAKAFKTLRAIAANADPRNAVLDQPELESIRLRCFLRGDLTTVSVF